MPLSMSDAELRTLIESYRSSIGGIIQACHGVMRNYGHICSNHRELIADVFNITQAELRGIISFYHDFRTTPQPMRRIRVCQAEACQALGSRKLTREVESFLGFSIGETPENSDTAFEPVYCLGLCAIGPAAEVSGNLLARACIDDIRDAL